MTAREKDFFQSFRVQLAIFIVVCLSVAIGIAAGIGTLANNHHTANLTKCLADYNNQSQQATQARATLNQEQIDATNTVIIAVSTAKSEVDVESALAAFLKTDNAIDKMKAEHPVPPPPSEVCK